MGCDTMTQLQIKFARDFQFDNLKPIQTVEKISIIPPQVEEISVSQFDVAIPRFRRFKKPLLKTGI